MKTPYIKFALLLAAAFFVIAPSSWPQAEQQEVRHHGMMHASELGHPISKTARLTVSDNPSAHELTLRIGPMNLTAHTDSDSLPQPAAMWLSIPFNGWLTAYHPSLVDSKGDPLPGRFLHQADFFNAVRPDILCPDKEERIFAVSAEMNDWLPIPGFGYHVYKGDRIRITAMFENPTAQNYRDAFLQVRIDYEPSSPSASLKNIYPLWFDVMACAESAYDLPAGISTRTGQFDFAYSGKLLNAGGHLGDFGQWLVLKNATTNQTIASLEPTLDSAGRILSMPVELFTKSGGIPLHRGDRIDVTDAYSNPAAKPIHAGAIGIVFGYFLPDDESHFSALRHPEDHP